MPRALVPLLLVSLALLALVVAETWSSPSDPVAPVGAASAAAPAESVVGPRAADARSAGGATAASVAREAVPIGEDAAPRAATVAVLVLDRRTSAPVAGADVLYLEANVRRDAAADTLWAEDPEEATRRYGACRRTDEHGRTRIPWVGSSIVFARKGDLQGRVELTWFQAPAAELRILVSKDVDVTVRVVDAAGQPAAGASVLLETHAAADDSEALRSAKRSTGTGGEVRFRSVQNMVEPREAAHHAPLHLVVRCAIPGFESPPVAVYRQGDPPPEPVLFTLSPTGSMRLRVRTAAGQSVRETVRMTVRSGGDVPALERTWFTSDADGELLLAHVCLGQEFAVHAIIGTRSVRCTARGPTRAGALSTVDITVPAAGITLRGRALDGRGAPIAGLGLYTLLKVDGGLQEVGYATADAAGRFAMLLHEQLAGHPLGEMVLRASSQAEAHKHLTAALRVDVLQSGEQDLGDVVFEVPRVLASGRVLGAVADRAPAFYVQSFDPLGASWRMDIGVSVHFTPPERIEFRGVSRARRMRVCITSVGYQPLEPVEFAPGAEGVLIQLRAGIRVTVRVDAGFIIPRGLLQLRLTALDGGAPAPDRRGGADRTMRSGFGVPTGYAGDLYRVAFFGVAPGRHELHGYLAGSQEPVVYLPDVEVSVERPVDPRLDPLDLRGKLRRVDVAVVDDATGAPPRSGVGAVFVASARAEEPLEGRDLVRGRCALVLPAERRAELRVLVDGYQEERFAVTGAEHTVRLRKVRLQRLEVLVEGAAASGGLRVRAVPRPPARAARMTLRFGEVGNPRPGVLSALRGAGPVEGRVGADGRTVLVLWDGIEYELEVASDRGGEEQALRIDGPRRVTGGAERFALRVVPR